MYGKKIQKNFKILQLTNKMSRKTIEFRIFVYQKLITFFRKHMKYLLIFKTYMKTSS